MNTIKFANKGNVKMIAHRGLSGLEVENTCPAFVAAAVKSYYGIETDVHVTKDGKFILVHDDDLKRVAGRNLSVEGSTFKELRAVRMKDTDGKTERGDLFLSTPEEYFHICKKYGKVSVLELKNEMSQEKIWEIAEIAQKMKWLDGVIFISFSWNNLVWLREKFPKAKAQFLTEIGTDEEIERMIAHKIDADFWSGCVTKEKVDRLHKAGRIVNCWTVDDVKTAERMKSFGVDMITTDILD
ncbi:MAG: hypothetical protein IJF64_03565 [Clostridia bacterium]|nr:hypothetical protein [Clostridia bacterium]